MRGHDGVEGVVVLDHNTPRTAFFSRPSPSSDVAEECVGRGTQNAASRVCTARRELVRHVHHSHYN